MKKLFTLILSIMAVVTLSAQTTTSSINGKVTDADGEALVGATIIAQFILHPAPSMVP